MSRLFIGALLGCATSTFAFAFVACSSDEASSSPPLEGDAANTLSDTSKPFNDDTGHETDAAAAVDTGSADAASDAGDASSDAAQDAAGDSGVGPVVTGYAILGEITYPFVKPYALAVDSNNHLFVSEKTDAADTHTLYLTNRSFLQNQSPGHSQILEFDAAGTYLGWIGMNLSNVPGFHPTPAPNTPIYGYDPGSFNNIRGMTFDAADHLFVLDNYRIQELDAAKAFVRWTGYKYPNSYGWQTTGYPDQITGPKIGGFTWPSGLQIHGGRLWVGTWYWNHPSFPNGQWNVISALDMTTGLGVGWLGGANDPATNVKSTGYFDAGADAGNSLEPSASVVHSSSPGAFSSPRHLVWHGDRVYVVDNTSDPVLSIFDEKGVMQPGRLSHLAGVGAKPFAIAVDPHGNVIVSDMYTGSVRFFTHQIDPDGELHQAAQWQLDTPSVPNTTYPIISDFAWDKDGNLYVAATTKNKVYKIKLTY